jgi:hypothetical protein
VTMGWEAVRVWGQRAWHWLAQLRHSDRARSVATILGVAAVIIFVPSLMYGVWVVANPETAEERIAALQIIAGIGVATIVATGSYIAWRSYQVNREGQITERFTRAIDQLGATDDKGNPRIEIRLGGIHAFPGEPPDIVGRDFSASRACKFTVAQWLGWHRTLMAWQARFGRNDNIAGTLLVNGNVAYWPSV